MNGEPVPPRSWEAATAGRARVVRMCVDQVGERGSPGRSRRARHEPDERVRGANPSDPPARPRQGLRASRDPDRRDASSRREATRTPPASSTVSSASSGAARNQSIASRFVSAQRMRGDRCPSVPCPGPARCGRCGNTVGSPKSQDFTVLDSGSRIPRCPSAGSTAATTSGRSESTKSKVFENPCGSSGPRGNFAHPIPNRTATSKRRSRTWGIFLRRHWARPVVLLLVCLTGAGTAFAQRIDRDTRRHGRG